MKQRRTGEVLLVGLLLASGAALMLTLEGLNELLEGSGWYALMLTLSGSLLLACCMIVCLFLIYQMDKRAGRLQRTIRLFEIEHPRRPCEKVAVTGGGPLE